MGSEKDEEGSLRFSPTSQEECDRLRLMQVGVWLGLQIDAARINHYTFLLMEIGWEGKGE